MRTVINGKKVRYVEGLGDKVERFLHETPLKHIVEPVFGKKGKCGGCRKRKAALNKLGKTDKP